MPFAGAYVALALVALLSMAVMHFIEFPAAPTRKEAAGGRPLAEIMRQPVFIVAAAAGALGYGVMNLLMAATPIAMQICSLPFSDAALVLEWHVIGMFAPGFFTGHLIRRFGALPVMGVGLVLNLGCIAIALSGVELHHFIVALFLLGVGWNFLFTGSTTLSLTAYTAEERDRAQGALNFCVFAHAGADLVRLGRAGDHAGLAAAELQFAGAGGADWRGADLAGARARRSGQRRKAPVEPALQGREDRVGFELVEDLVVQRVEAVRLDLAA